MNPGGSEGVAGGEITAFSPLLPGKGTKKGLGPDNGSSVLSKARGTVSLRLKCDFKLFLNMSSWRSRLAYGAIAADSN